MKIFSVLFLQDAGSGTQVSASWQDFVFLIVSASNYVIFLNELFWIKQHICSFKFFLTTPLNETFKNAQ